jgi:hypothetical protein
MQAIDISAIDHAPGPGAPPMRGLATREIDEQAENQ